MLELMARHRKGDTTSVPKAMKVCHKLIITKVGQRKATSIRV